MGRKEPTGFAGATPTSTPGAAGYAVLGGGYGADASPVECNGRHNAGGKLPVVSTVITPVILGDTRPRNNSGYGIPILGGSTPNSANANARRQSNNSGFGSFQRRINNYSGLSNQRSSFLPSNSAIGASGFNPGASGFNPGASGFNPGASGFNPGASGFNPGASGFYPGASGGPRPSRQMNHSELTELKDFLWKASISLGPGDVKRTAGNPNGNDDDCAAPGNQLPFYVQQFDTGTQRGPNGVVDEDGEEVAFMPLPRESVAMMVDAVRTSTLDDDEKCRFLFEIFDVDHKGVLTKAGVRAFLEATFAANGVEFLGDFDFDAVVDKVFAHCRNPETLTYNEFKNIFGKVMTDSDDSRSREELARLAAIDEVTNSNRTAKDIAAYEAAAALIDPEETGGRWYRFKKFCRMYNAEIFWVTLYLALMVGVFIAKASRFGIDPAVGWCPRIAKGFAEICLVNTMFVLLPMCRNFVTALRTLPIVVNHLPVDQHIEFHKICGIVLIAASLGHTGAWLAIVYYVRTVPLEVWKESRYYHLSFVRDENLFKFALRIPIWTGVVMLVCAAIAAPLCHPKFRRGNFNIFWISHLLFIPFLLMMMLHGVAAWVAAPQAYWWVLPPIVIYMIEKRYRMAHVFGGRARISNVQLSKETVAIFMKKPRSFGKRQRFQPGMYVFVNVPVISQFEWHPFTISSAPEDKFLSLHIRKAGDWTGTFYDLLEKLKAQNEASQLEAQGGRTARGSPYPTIYIDGPCGAPAQDYARYREVVLIGAGIGVTPFASILRSIMHQWESYRCPHCRHVRFPPSFQLRKIYFYWITREQEALSWFANTMNQLSEMDTENRLEIHNYFTSVKDKTVIAPLQALQNFIHETEGQDIISGLNTKQRTHFGRPDWKKELERVTANHRQQFGTHPDDGMTDDDEDEEENEREEIGVFFCGPKPLGNVIHNECARFNQSKIRWTPDVMFDFHSENF